MWQAPSQRLRALNSQKKREQERLRRPFHLRRVMAELKIESSETGTGEAIQARVILNDLSPKGIGLFSSVPFQPGQTVTIRMDDPQPKTLQGKIVWCQEYAANSKVLSAQSYSYRLGIKFSYENPAQEEEMKKYCEELCKQYLYSVGA